MVEVRRTRTALALACAIAVVASLVAGPDTGIEAVGARGGRASETADRLGRSDGPTGRVIGYVSSWSIYERGYEMADVPADRLTHLNYAFARVVAGRCETGDAWADVERPSSTDDATLPFRGNFNQLQVLRAAHPDLRLVLSVGGSTWSGAFADALATPAARQRFARSCAELADRYGFDGVSVDWEYPASPAEGRDLVAGLRALRTELDALPDSGRGPRLLTLAGPAGAPQMAFFDVPQIASIVDWVNVMTYDFAGPWSPQTGHNSPLYAYEGIEDETFTVESAMRRWVVAGMPPAKLNTGLAFYGRAFGDVTADRPGATFGSIPMGTTEPSQFDYRHIATGAVDASLVRFDEAAQVPYAFDPGARRWFSFDDPRSIAAKVAFTEQIGYGGVMIWELSNDTTDHALLNAVGVGAADGRR